MLRYLYSFQANQEDFQSNIKFSSYHPLNRLEMEVTALSPNGTSYIQCVEAVKQHNLIKLRVITNSEKSEKGATINIPCSNSILYTKYRDLRHLVRNSEKVLIQVPKLVACKSSNSFGGLYLLAYDFKVYKPKTMHPQILI